MARPLPEKKKPPFSRRAFTRAALSALALPFLPTCKSPSPKKQTYTCAQRDGISFDFENRDEPMIFGVQTQSIIIDNKSSITEKFHAMVGRHVSFMRDTEKLNALNLWMSFFDDLKSSDDNILEKARRVDSWIDTTIQYEKDDDVWGQSDYWASPLEVIDKGKGDCEDFACLKYYALRYLDVPAKDMYILVVKSKDSKKDNIDHALLIVKTHSEPPFVILNNDESIDGNLLVDKQWDNQYYAMNEDGAWSFPDSTVPIWGAIKKRLSACITKPKQRAHQERTRNLHR